jgi:hypothetical protein
VHARASALLQPFDVVKTRLQAQAVTRASSRRVQPTPHRARARAATPRVFAPSVAA